MNIIIIQMSSVLNTKQATSVSLVLVPPIAVRDHAKDEWMEVVGMNLIIISSMEL